MNSPAQKLTAFRYCKWRWLHFRRSWTDTRADRIPSWSRLFLRAYFRLLGLALLVAVILLLVLAYVLTPGVVWHAFDVLPGGGVSMILIVFALPAVVAYRWMRPVWHDLVIIRERAIDFTGGRFNTRAQVSHSVILGPLARTLNALAERMERLIAAQRELTNGISHELRTPLARVRFALEILRQPSSTARVRTRVGEHRAGRHRTRRTDRYEPHVCTARIQFAAIES